jgi:hypothetical protein
MLGSDHAPGAFLLDGYNCWRVWPANMLCWFGDDLLDQRNDGAPNLGVFDSRVRPYQRDPIGRREKSTYITRYRRPTFRAFRQMKLARRPLKEKRHRYPKDVRQLMKTAGADAVGALLVLLDLLKRQPQTIRQLHLSEVEHKSPHADTVANMLVYCIASLGHGCAPACRPH